MNFLTRSLVTGIMNELASIVGNYFADNLSQLKKLGLSYTHLRYSSQRAIPRNSEKLFQDVLNISAKVKRQPFPYWSHPRTFCT